MAGYLKSSLGYAGGIAGEVTETIPGYDSLSCSGRGGLNGHLGTFTIQTIARPAPLANLATW